MEKPEEENMGDRITRIAREQNVSHASAARAAQITSRLDQRLQNRRERNYGRDAD